MLKLPLFFRANPSIYAAFVIQNSFIGNKDLHAVDKFVMHIDQSMSMAKMDTIVSVVWMLMSSVCHYIFML